MKIHIAIFLAILVLFHFPGTLFAQDSTTPRPIEISKYALVIGNGAYDDLSSLANPVNDANDIAAALSLLNFSVETVINGSLEDIEDAVIRFKERLSISRDTYGFFYYAGHGVQSGGENFLIPVNANIPSENFLRNRAVSVQTVLDELNDAGNYLNVVVLDACRDNPFGWSRSSTRGLATVSHQPADSIIVYATSAGQRASDGGGRNGLFTSHLLNNLKTPGLEVSELFRRTGADVTEASGRQQIPAIYNQFFGMAYLGEEPDEIDLMYAYTPSPVQPIPLPEPVSPGKKEPASEETAKLWSLGASVGTSFIDPWLIGTLRGTLAPFRNSFLEIGFDFGLISSVSDAAYYSLYPFLHYAYYLPINRIIGLYAGAGGGYMIAQYEFPDGKTSRKTFAADLVVGAALINMINVSYTFITSFSEASNKLSVGYFYRF